MNQITTIVEFQAPTCDGIYPTTSGNWEPTGCDPECSFKCLEGFTKCGTSSCIDDTQSCVSGMPVSNARRRRNICPPGKESCPLIGRRGSECIDTSSHLEACGGCPGAGGVDCSALTGVADVSCVAGRCHVDACMRGYSRNGTSACVPTTRRK